MLKISDLKFNYGEIEVLHGISLNVEEGEIVALVGANAAGKSTLIKTISGIARPKSGSIKFEGQELVGMLPEKIVDLGVVQIPEGRRLFPYMSILENLEMGAYNPHARAKKSENLEKVYEMLPLLAERKSHMASSLSGGQQQMLAIGRAIMADPKILVLDEPTIGLAPQMVEQTFSIVKRINKESGISVLIVEQHVKHALEMANRGYVIENGNIVMEGKSEEILNNEYLRKAYLGM